MTPYSLLLYSSVLDSAQAFIAPLTTAAADWTRSIRSMGGFWQGGFSLSGTLADLAAKFNAWLGGHLVEKTGGKTTWEGMLYELELTAAGMRRVRSLDLMTNALNCTYSRLLPSSPGDIIVTPGMVGWTSNAASIARYGRREEMLTLGAVPVATATAVRDTTLATHAWPWPRPVGSHDPAEPARLTVRACGYIFTAAWQFVNVADSAAHNISDWIAGIIGADYGLTAAHGGATATAGDCQFLKTGVITANTLQATEYLASPRRAWEVLRGLTEIGDATAAPWELQADAGRVVNYRAVSATPRYYLRGGALYDTINAARPALPWTVRPAVVRDLAYTAARAESGSFLSDPRDAWIEEVEAGPGGLTLKTGLLGATDLLSSQLDYLQRVALPWPGGRL